MSKERSGLLANGVLISYVHGLWVVKALSLASPTALVVLVFIVLKLGFYRI